MFQFSPQYGRTHLYKEFKLTNYLTYWIINFPGFGTGGHGEQFGRVLTKKAAQAEVDALLTFTKRRCKNQRLSLSPYGWALKAREFYGVYMDSKSPKTYDANSTPA